MRKLLLGVLFILLCFSTFFYLLLNAYVEGDLYVAKIETLDGELRGVKGKLVSSIYFPESEYDMEYSLNRDHYRLKIINDIGGAPLISISAEDDKGYILEVVNYKLLKKNCVSIGKDALDLTKILISFTNCSSRNLEEMENFNITLDVINDSGDISGSETLLISLQKNGRYKIKDSL